MPQSEVLAKKIIRPDDRRKPRGTRKLFTGEFREDPAEFAFRHNRISRLCWVHRGSQHEIFRLRAIDPPRQNSGSNVEVEAAPDAFQHPLEEAGCRVSLIRVLSFENRVSL